MVWRRLLAAVFLWLAVLPVSSAQTRAVEDDQDLINWYYAATYGTGVYSAGDRTVGILQAPLSFHLRESNEEQWGMRITLPVSFGFYDFDLGEVVDNGLPSRVNTLSVVPGIEFEKQVTPRWLLKPYVSAGAGWELGGEESAWIYDAGLRSRYLIGERKRSMLSLVNRLSLAGYYPSGGAHEPFSLFAIGFDIEIPTRRTLFNRSIRVSILPAYYYYFKKLGFSEVNNKDNTIREQTELMLSLLAKEPFNVFGIDVDRIGIALRTNEDVTGFSVFTTLPF